MQGLNRQLPRSPPVISRRLTAAGDLDVAAGNAYRQDRAWCHVQPTKIDEEAAPPVTDGGVAHVIAGKVGVE